MQDWRQQMDQARGLVPIDFVLRRAQLVKKTGLDEISFIEACFLFAKLNI
ncbi:hypothetical protein [Desulfitobacterium sp.]|nr:hypothetical protein [Desulfitobacterium sp.]HVJ49960.1 hypothetical protein [Desulfitobacterium sp.]